jgi:hypothetical protein
VSVGINNGSLDISSGVGCGSQYNCGTFNNALINPNSFGFFFKPSASATKYYSLDQLNSARSARRPLRRVPGWHHDQLDVRL